MGFQVVEDRRHGNRLIGVGFANDDNRIGNQRGAQAVLAQFHGAGAVEKGPFLTQVFAAGDIKLGRHLVVLGFSRGIAGHIRLARRAFARHGTGEMENAFEQRGFSAGIGTDQSGDAGSRRRFAVHVTLPFFNFKPR